MKKNKYMTVKGQIKDRGQVKWTAMMLTEHVQLLKDLKEEDRYNTKPILDAFDLEAIYEEIRSAYMRKCEVELRLWLNQVCTLTGLITAIDLNKKTLCLEKDGQQNTVFFDDIIGAKTVE
ncbi:YolD-like family protein [Planococcus sp. N028]|uniref:YolD-like family protein n=1 Tax=Planococcus shixiaomingii TaxID=3058393 RepID=A0ABT8N248_9BACL|nr:MULTISPECIES: YolD-like family protein [unclassified Planococcus (in: firmicutes)]MDN7241966.1 YolD-like family protein [Planococcus sp. N028]WKA54249.1 YolD-like family protein [Planococcus sp. N022]